MSDSRRECGSCSACCTVIGVHEIEKGAYETCKHLCEAGCGIYAERPASCRNFACQWLRGALDADEAIDTEMRPDACGVVFDYQPDSAFGEVFTAWEIRPGASAGGHAGGIIRGLGESFLVIVMTVGPDGPGQPTFVGPSHLVTQASDVMWSRPADRGIGG